MNVVFAPDWRNGNPYQSLLADALRVEGLTINFLSEYRRGLPLWRGISRRNCELLHIHWPEAYFTGLTWLHRIVRPMKFVPDLFLVTRRCPLVVTAHNLVAHQRHGQFFAHRNSRYAYRRAAAVFAHSEAAKIRLIEKLGLAPEKCHVIPHGDPAVRLGTPIETLEARSALRLPGGQKICLIFGTVKPYKGIEEVIEFWATHRPPATLAITGAAESQDYERKLASIVKTVPGVLTRFARLQDHELRLWLSAADCAIFNYHRILTSGAACLARSLGIPILIPANLDTVELGEPHPLVRRFNNLRGDFGLQLKAALSTGTNYSLAAPWREATAWSGIAKATAEVYYKTTQAAGIESWSHES